MSQIEACRRGGKLISTETTVIDEAGVAVAGSKTIFLKSRAKGTERADKADLYKPTHTILATIMVTFYSEIAYPLGTVFFWAKHNPKGIFESTLDLGTLW
jgi:hypothetical protein